VQFFTPADLDTAGYLERRGGTMTGETRSKNYSGTIYKTVQSESRSDARMPLLPLERPMSMPLDESILFFAGKHNPLLGGRHAYWKILRLAGLYDPDPYHL